MGLFSWAREQFLKVIDWADDSKDVMVYKYPTNNKPVMKKSKLTVRESQEAIFVYKGQIADVFKPGFYSMETENIPVITSLASWKYAFENPLITDIYFVNTRQFVNYKWGTTNPIIVRDKDFGMVRLRGYGTYSFRVINSALFLKEIFGTSSSFRTSDIAEQLKSILVSGISDTVAESQIPLLDLAGNTLEFNELIKQKMQERFAEMGLELSNFYIENISVPEEVEKMLDTRSNMGILGDKMAQFTQYQAAQAMRDAAQNEGGGLAGMGAGMGAGVGIGNMMAGAFAMNAQQPASETVVKVKCPTCGALVAEGAKFCPECGKAMVQEGKACAKCGAKLGANAKFCPECGTPVDLERACAKCGAKLGANAKFCPECGEKND